MPMVAAKDFGTDADGGKASEYCTYCYQKGRFTWNGSLKDMTEKLASMHDHMGLSKEDARKMADEILPKLKRWKK
jgi:hypothetical protein